jgi:PAS domain S-box-containing protein
MIKLIALIVAALLQTGAAVGAVWIIRIARGKISWALIAIAFFIMAIRRILELGYYLVGERNEFLDIYNWIGIAISFLMAIAVFLIGKVLSSYNKTAKEHLESEFRFRALFDNSSDEIFLADTNGNFLEVNQVACDSLGYTLEELKTMNFKDIKTSKYARVVDSNIEKILQKGQHIYESEHLSKEGKVLSLEMKSRLIDYQGSKAIFSIARDITERKNMEQNILKAVIRAEERERERISKEIHDGLGPLLSTIKLYIGECNAEDVSPQERGAMFNQTMELIDEAISNTRTISNTLTPRIIKDFGLVKAVESFCKKIDRTNTIKIKFETTDVDEKFEEALEMLLYRIITELINNTIKHAKASKIEIYLERFDDILQMTYLDDGIGFDKEKVLSSSSGGIGLKNIISRLHSVKGTYQIHSKPDVGTLVVIEIKLEG